MQLAFWQIHVAAGVRHAFARLWLRVSGLIVRAKLKVRQIPGNGISAEQRKGIRIEYSILFG